MSDTDEHDGSTASAATRVTRREALAVGGAAVLAGCGVPDVLGSDSVTIDGGQLELAVQSERPQVTGPLPVDVARSHVAASRERAHSLLASVPLPLTPADLPNGAMREEVHHDADHAREHLGDAVEAPGTRERLDLLAHARGPAQAVAATWAYTQGDLEPTDVRDARLSVRDDVEQFRDAYEYAGADLVRAVVVHDAVEQWIDDAQREASGRRDRDDERTTALDVGERAGEVESARASLADARHVSEQFVEPLSDPDSVREAIVEARESLAATVEAETTNRRSETGEGDVDHESPVFRIALANLYSELPDEFTCYDAPGPAAAVVAQTESLSVVYGFESLSETVRSDDYPTVESVEDIEELRESAATAVEDALAESPDERLARTVLSSLAGWIEYADRDLTRYDDAVELDRIRRDLAV